MARAPGSAVAAAALGAAALLALGGCGFHLEGRTPLPATALPELFRR